MATEREMDSWVFCSHGRRKECGLYMIFNSDVCIHIEENRESTFILACNDVQYRLDVA